MRITEWLIQFHWIIFHLFYHLTSFWHCSPSLTVRLTLIIPYSKQDTYHVVHVRLLQTPVQLDESRCSCLTKAGASICVEAEAWVTLAVVGSPCVDAPVLATSVVDLAFVNFCRTTKQVMSNRHWQSPSHQWVSGWLWDLVERPLLLEVFTEKRSVTEQMSSDSTVFVKGKWITRDKLIGYSMM